MAQLTDQLYEDIFRIPLFDTHTHMDASHMSARGLHDIILYHMVISELYSAGCPDGARLSDEPDEGEVYGRLERAIPYLRHIQNTSCFWGARIILKDLYGWDKPITADNWKEIHTFVANRYKTEGFSREILKKANITRVCTELWRGRGGIANDVFQYSLEWAFFTRCQWGQYDTALLELENAWGQDVPGVPLPVTLDRETLKLMRKVKTLADVKEAIQHYVDRIPYGDIISTASHLSTDIHYRPVSDSEMEAALRNREKAGANERDIYANYINEAFLSAVEASGKDIVLQFSLGAEPLPYETGSKMTAETMFELAEMFSRHQKARFCIFLSSGHQNQSLCTLMRELPNVSAAGYWWHNFFPAFIRRVMEERLDMAPANKQLGFFSDAYCADWAYAKSIIVRKQLAEVLAGKIRQGQYSYEQAVSVAEQILNTTPQTLLGMQAG